jgi:hypothetical protein
MLSDTCTNGECRSDCNKKYQIFSTSMYRWMDSMLKRLRSITTSQAVCFKVGIYEVLQGISGIGEVLLTGRTRPRNQTLEYQPGTSDVCWLDIVRTVATLYIHVHLCHS